MTYRKRDLFGTVSEYDMFGIMPSFNLLGRRKAGSWIGIAFSVLTTIFLAIMFFYSAIKLAHRDEPSFFQYQILAPPNESLNISRDTFRIGFQLRDKNLAPINLSYFNITTRLARNAGVEGQTISNLALEPCPESAFENQLGNANLYYCIKDNLDSNILLQPSPLGFIQLDFIKGCDASNGTTCPSEADINKTMMGSSLTIAYSEWSIDPTDNQNPTKFMMKYLKASAVSNFQKQVTLTLGQIDFISDEGWLVSSSKNWNNIGVDSVTVDLNDLDTTSDTGTSTSTRILQTDTAEPSDLSTGDNSTEGDPDQPVVIVIPIPTPGSPSTGGDTSTEDDPDQPVVIVIPIPTPGSPSTGNDTSTEDDPDQPVVEIPPPASGPINTGVEFTNTTLKGSRQSLIQVLITYNGKKVIYNRSYDKIQDVLASISGLAGTIIFIASMIVRPYGTLKMQEQIINQVFEIKKKKNGTAPPKQAKNKKNLAQSPDTSKKDLLELPKRSFSRKRQSEVFFSPYSPTSQTNDANPATNPPVGKEDLRDSKSIERSLPQNPNSNYTSDKDILNLNDILPINPSERDQVWSVNDHGSSRPKGNFECGIELQDYDSDGPEHSQALDQEQQLKHESKRESRPFKINISPGKWLRSLIRPEPHIKLIKKGRKEISRNVDITTIIRKLLEVDKLKTCLMNKDQRVLFEQLPNAQLVLHDDIKAANAVEVYEWAHPYKVDQDMVNEAYITLKNSDSTTEFEQRLLTLYEARCFK